jgi:hypothetical protein
VITNIDFSEDSISPGESRTLRAWSDVGPLFVAIECFREPPTPPNLTACDECGSYSIKSGQSIEIKASTIFESVSGYLRVVVRDMSGDMREFKLTVSRSDEAQSYVER